MTTLTGLGAHEEAQRVAQEDAAVALAEEVRVAVWLAGYRAGADAHRELVKEICDGYVARGANIDTALRGIGAAMRPPCNITATAAGVIRVAGEGDSAAQTAVQGAAQADREAKDAAQVASLREELGVE